LKAFIFHVIVLVYLDHFQTNYYAVDVSRVTLSSLGVVSLPPDIMVQTHPGGDGLLRVIKILSTTSFRGEVQQLAPCCRFMACKRTLQIVKMLHRQN
jgi:hypothetical protein